jgi:hypothetical protein
MKTKAIAINITNPCSENWDLMEKKNDGNFCESCQKCVVDFSTYSNAEIVKILSSSKSDICGRLTNRQLAQLNHYLIAVPTNHNWLKYLGVLAIGASVFAGDVKANVLKKPEAISSSSVKSADVSKIVSPKKIYGYVFDENNKPIAGLRIVVANTKLFAKTDNNGRYEIILGKNSIPKSSLIKVESLKFEGSVEVNLSASKQANINLQELYMIMGKIALTNKN